jgi:predicted cupin superfamily sugar epimerase
MKPLKGEGGFYAETYRCSERIGEAHLPAGYVGDRSLSSAILYLLTPETFSALHRLKSDEIFHFYLGDPATMLQLHPGGSAEVITLGRDILNGQRVQITVPAGTWQGCFLNPGGRFALMGTTVAPGFEFADFEPADRKTLLKQYPAQKNLILRLTGYCPRTTGGQCTEASHKE